MASLATGLSQSPHFAALAKLIGTRFEAVPTESLLVYLVDNVTADALIYLAEQFDVLGVKGWNAATTEAERRALIKRAIEIHRYKGTPAAIKNSLAAIGFPNVTIQERLMPFIKVYDGTWTFNGDWNYGAGKWYWFSVEIDNNGVPVSPTTEALITDVINENKNVRSKLVELRFI